MSSRQNPHSPPPEENPDAKASADGPTADDSDVDDSTVDLAFDDEDVGEKLRHASEDELNEAPFGIIRVDDEGIVQFYNRYESTLSGFAPEEAVGQNFFTKLAPCSDNPLFMGRFKRGIRDDDLDERFTYTFTYKMRPTLVEVRLYRDQAGNNWLMIQKR